jgi:CheY-like chemotaxis protein
VIATIDDRPDVPLVLVGTAHESRRELLDMLLAGRGFEAAHRADGQGVLEYLQGETPDAVVLDFDLPGADGREICSRIRSIKRLENTAVVLITRSVAEIGGPDNLRATIRSTSADLVLPEPIGDKNLIGRLENLFRERAKVVHAAGGAVGGGAGTVGVAWSGHADSVGSCGPKLRTLIAEREAMQIVALEDEVRVLRAQLSAARREIPSGRAGPEPEQIADCARYVAELEQRNGALAQEVERLASQEARLRARLDESQATLAGQGELVLDMEQRLARLAEDLEGRRVVEAALRADLSEACRHVAELDGGNADLRRRIDELQGESTMQQSLLASLGRDKSALQASLSESTKEKSELELSNGKLLEELEKRRAIEAPLRAYLSRLLQEESGVDSHIGRGSPLQSAGSFRG